ncbi:sodium- and chloride-dependent betaine transporter-like [Pecten maximus]|uniref:sodium- and chloride-dependent betaine transporter-like n=1 Tax=Pecten maximus TaxID=6579 RepID=UPI0014586237|nr:sodium- and chloride-dependent betaine transporter-like [Pecten maximus]
MEENSAVTVKWTSRVEFGVALLGYSIGMPEFWRVPYLTYRNGGGPFVIVYSLLMLVCGFPLYFLELALSQYSGKGPWRFWDICPILRGIGIAIAVINCISGINTVILEVWALEYFINSFTAVLPWTNCDNDWNTPACYREDSNMGSGNISLYNSSLENYTFMNLTSETVKLVKNETVYHPVDSVEEFWLYHILRISEGINVLGTISVVFVAYLFLMRLIAAITIVKSVASLGKVLYITALLPVLLVLAIWIRALTLPGASKGLLYFVSADFRRFADPQLWIEASFQTFLTLGPGWGGLMMMGAHNKFRTNVLRSSILSTTATLTFGIINGLVVFSVLGVMSEEIGVPIADMMTSGDTYRTISDDLRGNIPETIEKSKDHSVGCCQFCDVSSKLAARYTGTHRVDRDVRLLLSRPLPSIVRIRRAKFL